MLKGSLDNLIEAIGGISKLAEALGVSEESIRQWNFKVWKNLPDVHSRLKINLVCRSLNIEEVYKD